MLSLDLSQDWTPSTAQFNASTIPIDVPNLARGILWYHKTRSLLYTGLVGEPASYDWSDAPTFDGNLSLWTYGLQDRSWGEAIPSGSAVWNDLIRPDSALTAQTDDLGFALNGLDKYASHGGTGMPGLLQFDMTSRSVSNITSGDPYDTPKSWGSLQFVPTWGTQGFIVAFGGWGNGMSSLDSLPILDPATQKWYQQNATGDLPAGRRDYCVAGAESTNGTFEIFFYGGNLIGGVSSTSRDTIHILTLPAFHWIQVQYTPDESRAGHTCNYVNNTNQIIVIGGVRMDSEDIGSNEASRAIWSRPDSRKQGTAVFNLNTLKWEDGYSASAPAYEQSDPVKSFYARAGE